ATNIFEIYNQYQTAEKKYTISQNIIVNLDDVNKIKDLGDKVSLIANKGVFISVNSLEYYYSKLKDVRVSLLSDAILDAKNRAEEIVKISDNRIGKLKNATNGVVQVLAKDSNEVSDYGSYDTSTIEKTIQVSVKANFLLN
ncbi:MAG: SIMPL domain-containing protein, partial [Candidatus Pacebacteria bacterium]|nr:SIMPL domain-containing protein [Candidatus Paceibacterota bacterium]